MDHKLLMSWPNSLNIHPPFEYFCGVWKKNGRGGGEGGILLGPKLSQEVNTKPWIDNISRFNFTPGTSWLLISTFVLVHGTIVLKCNKTKVIPN